MTPHLTDAELYDLLSARADEGSAVTHGHLSDCTRCQDDLATLEESISNFRVAATNFSVLHTPPRPAIGATIHKNFFALPKAVWATGLAAVMTVSAVTFATLHKSPSVESQHVADAPAARPVSDEALLQDIDTDLATPVPPSLQPLDTTPTASEQTAIATSN